MSLISSSPSPHSQPPSSPSTLLTIPPELLLQIISHLPSSSCLHALSLTSHTLNTFLHTHAATITNSLITINHPYPSQILNVQHTPYSAGFLTPTHPLILAEERRIQRDKILASGCHCPPCRLMLHSGTSSTSNISLHSSSESENDQLMGSCLPTFSTTTTRGGECKAKAALDRTIKLTEPGPQFLVFLERYGWEVEARFSIMSKTHQRPGSTKEEEEGEEVDDEKQDGESRRKTFEFMIGNYCVRRFLDDAEKELMSFNAATRDIPQLPTSNNKRRIFSTKLWKRGKEHHDIKKQKAELAPSRPPAEMMFGEIEKTPETAAAIEKDTWVKGLVWYHGSNYSTGSDEAVHDLVIGSDKAAVPKTKRSPRNCMRGVKASMKKARSSVVNMLRHLRCVGDFQALDD